MIQPEHRAFARAVVALAREHKMTDIQLAFRCSLRSAAGSQLLPWSYEVIKATWCEGRHGEESNIAMETRATEGVTEKLA